MSVQAQLYLSNLNVNLLDALVGMIHETLDINVWLFICNKANVMYVQ
jgi:hypothetical protein